MVQRYRHGFTTAERTEMWDRWQRGESLRAIGRTFGKPYSSIYGQLCWISRWFITGINCKF